MKHTIIPLLCALVILAAMPALAGDVKVIANSSVGASSVSADELKNVFLGSKSALSDGSRVDPVLLKGGAAHASFLKDYVGKTESALDNYYRSLVFTGKGSMPKSVPSEADMVAYVAKTKGAIGYVSAATAAAGVKTLDVK